MQIIYKRIKGKSLKYESYEGVICGYSDTKLVLATLDSPGCSFRKTDKEKMFIEEEFRDTKYRYCWANESEVYNQHPRMKYL